MLTTESAANVAACLVEAAECVLEDAEGDAARLASNARELADWSATSVPLDGDPRRSSQLILGFKEEGLVGKSSLVNRIPWCPVDGPTR